MNKRKNAFLLSLFVVLLMCASGDAQQARRRVAAVGPEPNQLLEREQRSRDQMAVMKMEDPGFDFAIVTSQQANIREEPSISGQVLLRAKRGDMLALVNREVEGSWLRVIHIESATEGWVDSSVIVSRFTERERRGPTLQAERTGTYEDPDIEITNDAYKDLTLRIGGVGYTIPAHQKRTLTVKSGTYNFYGYAPGVSPAFGEKRFENGYTYTWRFWIETR